MSVDINEQNFKEETSEGLVLLDFHAPWCGPCRMLAPLLDQLENVKVAKVNVDDNKDLAVEYNISAIPKIVFLKDGTNVGEYAGMQTKEFLQNKINELNGE